MLTVAFKANLLAPGKTERFLFRARKVKPGGALTVCEPQAIASASVGKEQFVTTITGTLMALFERQGVVQ